MAVLLLNGVIVAWFPSRAAADTTASITFSNTYPYENAMLRNQATYDWWIDENGNGTYQAGESYSPAGYSYRNCTDGVAYWTQNMLGVAVGGWGDANNWDNNAGGYIVKAGSSNTIEPGDIAQSNDGTYGHVGFVTEVVKNSAGTIISIRVAEYNKAGTGRFSHDSYATKNSAGKFKRTADGTRDWDSFIDVNGAGSGTSVATVDTDLDGIVDTNDQCPNIPGPASTAGCPDADGDGMANSIDTCVATPGVYYLSGCPQRVTSMPGDFNGDGKLDTAAFYDYPPPNDYAVALFLWAGDGQGGFSSPNQTGSAWYNATGWDARRLIPIGAADYNEDGRDDISAFYRYDENIVRIFTWFGNADGTFSSPSITFYASSGWNASYLIPAGSGDFDGDGHADMSAFYDYPDSTALAIFTWYGNGDGTFSNPNNTGASLYYSAGWEGLRIIPAGVGDFNNDNREDLSILFRYDGEEIRAWTFSGNTNRTFDGAVASSSQTGWEGYLLKPLGTGDFNNDGNLDIAAFYNYPDDVLGLFVWSGNGMGTVTPPTSYGWYAATGWEGNTLIPTGIADFNSDNYPDIAGFYRYENNLVRMFTWRGGANATFFEPNEVFSATGWEGFSLIP